MLKQLKILPVLTATTIILSVAPATAADGYTCVFQVNCYEDTGCSEDSPINISVENAEGNQPTLVLPSMSLKAIKQIDEAPGIVSGTVSYVSHLERNTVHLLTIFEGGSARFASHSYLNKPFSIASQGECKPM